MVHLYKYKGFACLKQDHSFEFKTVYLYCFTHDIPLIRLNPKDPLPEGYIPQGTVEWIDRLLETPYTPDYYPTWLEPYLHRKVWKSQEWLFDRLFVKPADSHKRFNGFVTDGTYKNKKKPPYYYSEVVNFTNEWRYYISKGNILAKHWYSGDEINTPDAPELDIPIPKNFYGTLDFGTLDNGNFALVEAHPPYACGWYGKMNDHTYIQWLVDGWIYLTGG